MNLKTLAIVLGSATVALTTWKFARVATAAPGPSQAHVSGQLVQGDNFSIDGSQLECKAGAECKVDLTLKANPGFHVNKDYPYKFKANDVAGVDFTGTDAGGKNVFSKAAGDFAPDPKDEKLAVMHVHFKAAKAGSVALSGTYKLAVCNADNCQFKPVDLSMTVAIK